MQTIDAAIISHNTCTEKLSHSSSSKSSTPLNLSPKDQPTGKFWDASESSSNSEEEAKNAKFWSRYTRKGNYGTVTLCRNYLDQKAYAVKRIRFHSYNGNDSAKNFGEVQILSSLRHQHVVGYHQAWTEACMPNFEGNTILYMQMEFCPHSLHKLIEEDPFKVEKAWLFFQQIVEGVSYIHSKKIVHKDLSARNILLDVGGNMKIADFGVAELCDNSGVACNSDEAIVGNQLYRAPEIELLDSDPKS